MRKFFWLLCFVLSGISLPIHGQVDRAVHFSRDIYKAGLQNWDLQQDESGLLFIANNEGLLTYDGVRWSIFPLPNSTIVRAIGYASDKRIYAGGQDELGYFEADHRGSLIYHSLTHLIDTSNRQFADIWRITFWEQDVFFQSFSHIFQFSKGKMIVHPAPAKWVFLGTDGKQIFAQDAERGIFTLQNSSWNPFVAGKNLFQNAAITSMTALGQKTLITTTQHGLFILSGTQMDRFSIAADAAANRQHFTASAALPQGNVLLGTYENGALIIDTTGQILQVINAGNGLRSNSVKAIYADKEQQVWMGLEDGIAFMDLNSPVRWLNPPIFNRSQGYSVATDGAHMYFATSTGLYEMPYSASSALVFDPAAIKRKMGGLTWQVTNQQNQILVGRDDGFYRLSANKLVPVDQSSGYWIFRKVKAGETDTKILAGHYNGVSLFSENNGRWSKLGEIPNLNTSARFLEYDSTLQAAWVSHPYRGLYKIDLLSNTVTFFTQNGLPATLNNHIFRVGGKVLIATQKGIYQYNPQTKQFETSPAYSQIFGNLSLRYLRDDEEGNLWFVSEKKLGVVDAASQKIIFFPELERKILSGFEFILPLRQGQIIIGGETGFFALDYKKYLKRKGRPQVFIRSVLISDRADSLLYSDFGGKRQEAGENRVRLSHHWKEIFFRYAAPYSSQSTNLLYSVRLRGLDDEWSQWSNRTEKEYSHLPPGNYVFEVKVRNNLNEESAIAGYAFEILAPWYQTIWAWLGYLLIFTLAIVFLFRKQEKIIRRRHEKKLEEERIKHQEKQKLQAYEHQLALEKSERELMQLKNEKLESDLAASAMSLVQKKEFLLRIKEEISRLNKTENKQIDSVELKRILRELTSDDKMDDEWDQFSMHFNSVHNAFLVTLKNKYPQLTAHDLKLCAYLRLNLSTKEMARLMSISVRGVEINRYRLRKKLQLEPKENLFEFLMQLSGDDNPASTNKEDLLGKVDES